MDLIKAILSRNDNYAKASDQILDHYTEFLGAVFEKVSEIYGDVRVDMKWITVDFHSSSRAFLNFIGVSSYKIGSTIQTPSGEVVYIDEQNADTYRKMIRFLFPTKLIVAYDVDGLVKFIEEYNNLAESTDIDEIEMFITDPEFLADVFTAFGKPLDGEAKRVKLPKSKSATETPRPKVEDSYDGFDLSSMDLDEVQKFSLRILGEEGNS